MLSLQLRLNVTLIATKDVLNAICATYAMTSHHSQRRVLFDAIYAILHFLALCCYLCFSRYRAFMQTGCSLYVYDFVLHLVHEAYGIIFSTACFEGIDSFHHRLLVYFVAMKNSPVVLMCKFVIRFTILYE